MVLIVVVGGFLFGQTTNCDLYVDELEQGDTLKVTINFFVNRDEIKQEVLVYIDEFKKKQALINTDIIKNKRIELSKEKSNTVRVFETSVRKQSLKSNMPLSIHSLAKYEISYKKGSITYYSKDEYYSLCDDL